MQEPYHIKITDAGSTAYYLSDTDYGGSFQLSIEVFDWQTSTGGPDQIQSLWSDSQVFGAGVDLLTIATVSPGSRSTSMVYRVTIPNLGTVGAGDQEVFIIAGSAFGTYKPNIDGISGFIYPDQPLASYALGKVTISGIQPNQPPVAVADQTAPLSGSKPLSVHLDPTGSYDPDPGDFIALFEWDIDADGTYEYSNTDGAVVDHVFTENGVFQVQLRVTDSHGATDLLDTPLNIIVGDSWPMGFYDQGNTCYNPNSSVAPPLDLVFDATVNGYCNTQFAIGNGKIYYPDSNGTLRCVDQANGAEIWNNVVKSSPVGFWLGMSPALWNGHVISGGNGMWSFDGETGAQDWHMFDGSGFEHQGMVVVGDTIFVRSTSGTYRSLQAVDGSQNWSIPWSVFPLMTTAYGEVSGVGYCVTPYGYAQNAVKADDGSPAWSQSGSIDNYGNVMVIGEYAYFGGSVIYKTNIATGVAAASYNLVNYQPLGMCANSDTLFFKLRQTTSPYAFKIAAFDMDLGFKWETPFAVCIDHLVYSGGVVWTVQGVNNSQVYLTALDPATGSIAYQDTNPVYFNMETSIANVNDRLYYFGGGHLYCFEHHP